MPTALQNSVILLIEAKARRVRNAYENMLERNCLVKFNCPVLYLANGNLRLRYALVHNSEQALYGISGQVPYDGGNHFVEWHPLLTYSNDQLKQSFGFDPTEDKVGFKAVEEYCTSFLETYEALKKECEEEQPTRSEIALMREEISILKKALADTLDLLQKVNKS
jgi:hypothetical protein